MSAVRQSRRQSLATGLRGIGGVFVLLFLMAGQNGQEVVQGSFLMVAAICLGLAEWWPGLRA